MRHILTVSIVAFALTGCQGSAPEPSDEPAPSPTAVPEPSGAMPGTPSPVRSSVPITAAEDLVGEYRIAGVDGRDIDLPHGITARITDAGIHVTSDCVNLAWSWFFEGARLVTERVPVEGCGRGLFPEEEAIVAAFNSASDVGRTPANGIEFRGGRRSVLLFGQ